MKSGKQRGAELTAKRQAKRMEAERAAELARRTAGETVDRAALAPDGSYSVPVYVERGYYVDVPFVCRECGAPQTWTASQQKWWYEVAKGGVWTTARLCRPCRQRELARREEARRVAEEGRARKARRDE